MHRFAIASALFHLAIFAITFMKAFEWERLPVPAPLSVEIIDPESAKAQEKKPSSQPQEAVKSNPALLNPQDQMPKEVTHAIKESEPLKESDPQPKIPNSTKPLPDKIEELKKEIPIPPVQKPKTPPHKTPPIKPKVTSVKPNKPKKKTPPKESDFSTVLKNLAPTPSTKKGEKGSQKDKNNNTNGSLEASLNQSELARVRQQIEEAWELVPNIKNADTIKVKIKIIMNPDRTVQSAHIASSALMGDTSYKIVAESALRAVNTFKYRPLEFPVNKYKSWREVSIIMEPKHIM